MKLNITESKTAKMQLLPLSLLRLLGQRTLNQINVGSRLIAAILAVLLIATAPEEFAGPEVLLHSPLRGVTRVWASMFF